MAIERRLQRRIVVVLAVVLVAAGGLTAGLLLTRSATPRIIVPASILKDAGFPVYVPKEMPGNYSVDATTLTLQENGTVLVFTAKDSAGGVIFFTEQKKPTNVNFNDFYRLQFKNSRALDDTPYSSVIGESKNGQSRLLSVVTDKTWILVSTRSPIGENNYLRVAKSFYQAP